MKRLLILLLFSSSVYALPAQKLTTLTWTNPGTLMNGSPYLNKGGLKIYCNANDLTGLVIDIPDPDLTTYQLIDVISACGSGSRSIAMTAYDSSGIESPLSNVKSYVEWLGDPYAGNIPSVPRID